MKSSTNVWTYVLLTFIFLVFITGIQIYAGEQLINPNSNLDDKSVIYIASILDIDLSDYNIDKATIENNDLDDSSEATGASLKDFAIEFFYARTQANKVVAVVKNIYSFPSTIADLFRIPEGNVRWIFNILNWFWRIAILIAGYYFIRGLTT